MILALNIILMAFVFLAVVGALALTILGSRPGRQTRPARPGARQSTHGLRGSGMASIGRVEA